MAQERAQQGEPTTRRGQAGLAEQVSLVGAPTGSGSELTEAELIRLVGGNGDPDDPVGNVR